MEVCPDALSPYRRNRNDKADGVDWGVWHEAERTPKRNNRNGCHDKSHGPGQHAAPGRATPRFALPLLTEEGSKGRCRVGASQGFLNRDASVADVAQAMLGVFVARTRKQLANPWRRASR